MDIEELKAMIPSETVRKFVLDTGWTFTDMQKAALLFHNCWPLEEQYFWLRSLRDKTEDENLRKQITEYLSCREQGLQDFKDNRDRSHIYVLKIKDEDEDEYQYYNIQPKGFFFDWELAYEHGKRRECPFQIEKFLVCDVSKPSDDCNSAVAEICFNEDGKKSYFWSSKFPFYEERDDYFTFVFYEVPNPFERGDIVRLIGTEDYGIVEISQKQWKDNLIKWRSPEWLQKGLRVDYSDVQIRVVFPNEDGDFCHAHINPVDLELYHPEKDEETGWSSLDLLLMCASDLYKGKGLLDDLYYYTDIFRKSKKEE